MKVANDAADARLKADQEYAAKQKIADEAAAAKRKADEDAVAGMKNAVDQQKQFLSNAFKAFDKENAGFLTPDQIQTVLESLGLPAASGDVDDLVQVLDVAKDEVVHRSEWMNHMPQEMAVALMNHPL